MKHLTIVVDRFEGKYAICEDEECACYAIDLSDLPSGLKNGSVLIVSDDGTITYDEGETLRRRQRIAEKQRALFTK